jgi:hypothetical protein
MTSSFELDGGNYMAEGQLNHCNGMKAIPNVREIPL